MFAAFVRVATARPAPLSSAQRFGSGGASSAAAGDVSRRQCWSLTAPTGKRFEQIHAHFATAAAEVAVLAGQLSGLPVTVTAHAKDIHHRDNAPLLPARLSPADRGDHGVRSQRRASPAGTGRGAGASRRELHAAARGRPQRWGRTGRAWYSACVGWYPRRASTCCYRPWPSLRTHTPTPPGDPRRRTRAARSGGPGSRVGLADRVRFAGAVSAEEVAAAYRRAAMVALPCRVGADGDRDGLPTVLVEAMGYALPVISSELAGIDELVEHGHSGLLVAAGGPRWRWRPP